MTLGDYPPHALIGGPSGTGKTNLIYAWIGALAARYSPAELAFYLLDFKEGVSFARFAPGRRDPSWLPHVRLVGVNVNTDREFGLALLRFLGEELRRRADAAKQHEVTKLAELRAEDPTGHWPRIVAVVDEFQVLLAGRDVVAAEAADLLEDLARRGRSQGIHLVLASQDVSGIEALWGRPALVAQFTLRIALPKALAGPGRDATTRPSRCRASTRWSTPSPAWRRRNQVVRVPSASDWETLERAAAPAVADARRRTLPPPRLFDGDAVPRLADSPGLPALARPGPGGRRAGGAARRDHRRAVALGARRVLPPAPGPQPRGARHPGRRGVRGARHGGPVAGRASTAPGAARFSHGLPRPGRRPGRPRPLRASWPTTPPGTTRTTVGELMAEAAERARRPGKPHFLLLFAVDAARRAGRAVGRRPAGAAAPDPARRAGTAAPTCWAGGGASARLRDDLGGPAAAYRPDRRLGGAGRPRQRAGSPLYPGTGGAGLVSPALAGAATSTGRCTAPAR